MKYRKIIMGNLISSVSVYLLAIHSSKSHTGYLEIRFVYSWGLVCLLSCLNPIIENPQHSQKYGHREKVKKIMRYLSDSLVYLLIGSNKRRHYQSMQAHKQYFSANNLKLLLTQNPTGCLNLPEFHCPHRLRRETVFYWTDT